MQFRGSVALPSLMVCFLAVSVAGPGMAQESEKSGREQGEPALRAGRVVFTDSGGLWEDAIPLAGGWRFSPGLVEPERLTSIADLPELFPRVVNVPGQWEPSGPGDTGAGTYAAVIVLPETRPSLALRVRRLATASRIYWNGNLIYRAGRPALEPERAEPTWQPAVVPLNSVRRENTLIVQISNYSERRGGMVNPLQLGEVSTLFEARQRTLLLNLFLLGVLLTMAVYHVFLYLYRRSEAAPALFAIVSFILATRIGFTDELLIREIIPQLSHQVVTRVNYLTISSLVLVFPRFMLSLFRASKEWWFWRAIAFGSILYSAVTVAAPLHVFIRALPLFQGFTIIAGTGLVVVVGQAILRREEGAWLFFIGFLAFFLTVIFDILRDNFIFRDNFGESFISLSPFGLAVFTILQAVVLTKQFAGALSRSEQLTESLSLINESLRRFVPKEFLNLLRKESITDIELGNHTEEAMAVMFLDIRSFTSLSEELSPTENFAFINSFLSRMGPVVRRHGGFVDKYVGDGIMALFPNAMNDAVAAAVELRRELQVYNGLRNNSGYKPVDFGIGIHAGGLMLGTIGESQRMDSTVISSVVNLASRLEGVTKEFGCGVVISERVAEQVGKETWEMRYLGAVSVKGASRPVHAYEVFEGEGEEIRARRRASKAAFEAGVRAALREEHQEALTRFHTALELSPDDPSVDHYIRQLRAIADAGAV